jgi:hypothetical protein
MIALLFCASLLAQLPMGGLSAAPFGIAERAAEAVTGSDPRRTITQIALAN